MVIGTRRLAASTNPPCSRKTKQPMRRGSTMLASIPLPGIEAVQRTLGEAFVHAASDREAKNRASIRWL